MQNALSRRRFLASSVAAGAACGYFVNPSRVRASTSPNEKLRIGVVGAGGKGWHNVHELTRGDLADGPWADTCDMVALCDVDTTKFDKAAAAFPNARKYRDYREMFNKEQDKIDAAVVSTADHNHAPATSIALSMGKHVYCEKPLTHTVAEARAISELAAKAKVATQMGIQIHAKNNYRRVVELVQCGAIGRINEVYTWCNKGWSDGRFKPTGEPAPENLDWDLWLGPAKRRPYSPNIHPGNWRRFWEYGSGTFGDMACHIMDLPFWALDLRYPTSVSCEGPEVHPDGAPSWVKTIYEFPAEGDRGPIKFHWSDGKAHFDIVEKTMDMHDRPLSTWGLGVLFVGDKGMLAADYNRNLLLPKDQFADFQPPEPSIPESVGHWEEWVQACKTGSPTTCNFDYAGRLTETVLLGIVAFRSGEKLQWDAKALKATNTDKAAQFVDKPYRKGWELAS